VCLPVSWLRLLPRVDMANQEVYDAGAGIMLAPAFGMPIVALAISLQFISAAAQRCGPMIKSINFEGCDTTNHTRLTM
jgi:hypothetical protein